ncbi:Gfo/Idh/MocA family protein [Pseudochelatococcus sp. B33]
MLKAAIAGLGWWGRTLVRSVQGRSDDLGFVAGATGRRALAEDFAAEAGIALLDDLDALLRHGEVEAVVLATPHRDHARQIVQVAEAGRHVFVEKPFTLDRESAERAVAAVQANGVVLGLGHNRRFHPHMAAVRARVAEGALGTLLHCEGTMTAASGLFLNPQSWRLDPAQSPAGGLAGLGIHMIDAMIDIVGPIDAVCCQSVSRAAPNGNEDTTSMLLRFSNGATGFVSCISATAPLYRFCLYGSGGHIEIRGPTLDDLIFTPAPDAPPSAGAPPKPAEHRNLPGIDTVRLELEAFARACRGEAPFPITHAEMIHGAAVFEAVAGSATTRSWRKVTQ